MDEVVYIGFYWMKNGVDFKKVCFINCCVGLFKDGEVSCLGLYFRIIYVIKLLELICLVGRNLFCVDIFFKSNFM